MNAAVKKTSALPRRRIAFQCRARPKMKESCSPKDPLVPRTRDEQLDPASSEVVVRTQPFIFWSSSVCYG